MGILPDFADCLSEFAFYFVVRNSSPENRVEGLGIFGRPTGKVGTVERTNEEDVVVKWDDDGRKRLRQTALKEIS